MAKRSKALPVRKSARSRDDDSVLIRTAESLGRMIGSLQRQLQDAASQVPDDDGDMTFDVPPELPQLDDVFGGEKRKRAKSRAKSSSSRGAAGRKRPRKSATSRQGAVATRRRPGARRSPNRTTAAGRSRSRKRSRKR